MSSDKIRNNANSDSNSTINSLITWSVGGVGIATFVWGIYEYRKNRILKRQEILFDLINEFDDQDNKMKGAKDMLDDLVVEHIQQMG